MDILRSKPDRKLRRLLFSIAKINYESKQLKENEMIEFYIAMKMGIMNPSILEDDLLHSLILIGIQTKLKLREL